MANVIKDIPNLNDYNISNIRDYCYINKTKEKCSTNLHCAWSENTCKIGLNDTMIIDFVNKVIEDFIQKGINYKEIIQEGNYYVSDIVNQTQYSNRIKQTIIKTSNYNIKKIMNDIFNKDNIPIIGKKKYKNIIEIYEEQPTMTELGKQLIQQIISNKDSIIRAFVNCYYWVNNPLFDNDTRNLGYYNENIQSTLTQYFKAKIIDFIQNIKNEDKKKYDKYLNKFFNNNQNFFESALNKFRKSVYNTDGILELYILSFITNYRIVVYDNYNNVVFLFLQGDVEINQENIKKFTSDEYKHTTIFIKFDYEGMNKIPKNIYSIYYN
jgi:hypothetical protein